MGRDGKDEMEWEGRGGMEIKRIGEDGMEWNDKKETRSYEAVWNGMGRMGSRGWDGMQWNEKKGKEREGMRN